MNKYKKIIREIAWREGTSPKKVYRQIQEAINVGFQSSNPGIQREWGKIHIIHRTPTPEEIIEYCVQTLKQNC